MRRTFYGILFDYAPLFYGKVVDFFDFDFFNFTILGRNYERWPIFNIADASVTLGVLILLIFYRQTKSSDEVESKKSAELEKSDESQNLKTAPLNSNDAQLNNEKGAISNDQTDQGKTISV